MEQDRWGVGAQRNTPTLTHPFHGITCCRRALVQGGCEKALGDHYQAFNPPIPTVGSEGPGQGVK